VYKAITGITTAAPARITSPAHGVPDGWSVAVVSVQGMRQINAKYDPPRSNEFHKATVVDSNTVDLFDVNAAGFTAYASGGYLQYLTPVDLAGFTARMQIRLTAEAEDPPLVSLTSSSGITLNNTTKTITITISAADTADLDFAAGVFDLELISGSGVVTSLLQGTITVEDEVTR